MLYTVEAGFVNIAVNHEIKLVNWPTYIHDFLLQYYKEWQENECDLVQNRTRDTFKILEEKHINASIGLAKVRNL